MKIKLFAVLASMLIVYAFRPATTDTFAVDTKVSSIQWISGKVGGSHKGSIKIAAGNLIAEGNSLRGGDFTIDMRSIVIADLKGTSNQSLLNHLKSEDFFSVAKNPTAIFKITNISPAGTDRLNITGNLTIKGITNSITFPASVKIQKNTLVAVAKGVRVDRTKYDIKYRSMSFFGDIGDKAIDDEFELAINLVAKK